MKSEDVLAALEPMAAAMTRPHTAVSEFLVHQPIDRVEDLPRAVRRLGIKLSVRELPPHLPVNGWSVGRYILVNSGRYDPLRHVKLAHELGHYWMHHRNGANSDRSTEDLEATIFAYLLVQRLVDFEDSQRFLQRDPGQVALVVCGGFLLAGLATAGVLRLVEHFRSSSGQAVTS